MNKLLQAVHYSLSKKKLDYQFLSSNSTTLRARLGAWPRAARCAWWLGGSQLVQQQTEQSCATKVHNKIHVCHQP